MTGGERQNCHRQRRRRCHTLPVQLSRASGRSTGGLSGWETARRRAGVAVVGRLAEWHAGMLELSIAMAAVSPALAGDFCSLLHTATAAPPLVAGTAWRINCQTTVPGLFLRRGMHSTSGTSVLLQLVRTHEPRRAREIGRMLLGWLCCSLHSPSQIKLGSFFAFHLHLQWTRKGTCGQRKLYRFIPSQPNPKVTYYLVLQLRQEIRYGLYDKQSLCW